MQKSLFLRRLAALSVVAVLATAAAACGDDGGGDATGSPIEDTAGNDGEELTGEPIRVATLVGLSGAIQFPQHVAGLEAAAAAINAEGGINGRPVELEVCDGQSPTDPNPSTRCARDFAGDGDITGVLAPYSSFGAITSPIWDEAGLANIGNVALSVPELTLPSSFPLSGITGPPMGNLLVDEGAEQPSVAYIDIEAGATSVGLIDSYLEENYGKELLNKVPIPLTATDVAPQVAAAARDSDGIALSLAPTQVAQFVRTFRQGDYDQILVSSSRATLPPDLEALGADAEGLYVVAGLPFVSSDDLPGIQRFKEEMAEYEPDAAVDEVSLTAWVAMWAFANVARDMDGEVTRENVLETWQSLDSLDVFGLLPEDFDPNRGSVLEGQNRVANVWVRYGQVQDGVVVDIRDEWVQAVPRVEE